jgi:hypothetical protein
VVQLEHFSVLVLKVSHSKFWLFQPVLDIWIGIWNPNTDLDPGSRPDFNADPTGSGSETLLKMDSAILENAVSGGKVYRYFHKFLSINPRNEVLFKFYFVKGMRIHNFAEYLLKSFRNQTKVDNFSFKFRVITNNYVIICYD